MIYLSQLLGNPILDAAGTSIGTVSDLGIATGEVFPRVTSLAFMGPGHTPFMISWRKYVDAFDSTTVTLKVEATDLRFSYLQPDEILIARDLLNKQIVDTRGMRVVRVNDLKLSDTSSTQLRLLGAEVGARGLLRSLSPRLETLVCKVARSLGKPVQERIIAWNYMDLVERDLKNVKLSVSHKTLDELHPADIADIIEQLDPRLRGQVFAQLDDERAADAVAELDDDEMAAELVGAMTEDAASKMLSEMDPDDAAELASELGVEKAEKLLRLMGVEEQHAIRQLLGYREGTAGRIMTSEFVALPKSASVDDATLHLASLDDDFETVSYVYTTNPDGTLDGVVTLHDLLISGSDNRLRDIARTDVVTATPEDDQEDVAEGIAKYNLLAMPVVDESRRLIGIVTVDDALEVLQEEHEEDLRLAGTRVVGNDDEGNHLLFSFLMRELWVFAWAVGMLCCQAAVRLALGANLLGLVVAAGMPICLHVADTMVRYVTDSFIEHDADDEDAPSLLGFAIRGIGVALVFGGVVVLLALGALGVVATLPMAFGDPGLHDSLVHWVLEPTACGFVTSAAVSILTFASAPAYLAALRRRDAAGQETSGLPLRLVAFAVAIALYVALATCWLVGHGVA